jgi:signal transduction histidine kinase
MNASSLLCGMLVAWTIAQVALSAYFALAYLLGRRDVAQLLFAVLCFALAFATFGVAMSYGTSSLQGTITSTYLTRGADIAATAINLHFAMRYAGVRRASPWVWVIYAVAVPYELLTWTGHWWRPHSFTPIVSRVFGQSLIHYAAMPNPIAMTFYAVAVVEVLAAMSCFYWAYRAGRRDALLPLLGGVVVALCVGNDILMLIEGLRSVYLIPHGFLVYAFAVASSLLVRQRRDAGELEEAASSLRQELRHSHAELRQVQDELAVKRQLAAVGELAAAIAHEVRNPLAVIVNAVAGLRRKSLRDPDRDMLLGIVDEEAARLNRLVTDLLRFARPVNVNYSAVSLRELTRRAEDSAGAGYVVEIDMGDDPTLWTVSADLGLLRLVFDNVVENAWQAMPDGGRLTIRAERETQDGQDFVRLDVRDTGQGMNADVRARAIDPFFTTRPSGTGLGLPIVERIMAAHGGSVRLESEPAVGTTVSLLLPVSTRAVRVTPAHEPAVGTAQGA